MCNLRTTHRLVHDRRPVIADVDNPARFLVVPYARPMACHCGEGEHIAPGLKCDVHDCCTKEVELVLCPKSKPCPNPVQYHIYEQAPGPLREHWWRIDTIDKGIASIETSKAMTVPHSALFIKARAVYLAYRVEAQQQISELTQAARLVDKARLVQLMLSGLESKEREKAMDRSVRVTEEKYLDVCVRLVHRHYRLCAALELWGKILARCQARQGSTIDGIEPEAYWITQTQAWNDIWAPCIPHSLSPSSRRKLESVLTGFIE